MHYPVHFQIGPVDLPAHRLFELLAFLLGYRLYLWLRKRSRDPISDTHRLWIFLGAAAGAWLGCHVLGILERPDRLGQFHWLLLLTDKTIVGGLLGGLIGVEWTKKRLGVRHSSGDLMSYPILLGLAVGRIGCHLAGLEDGTHGRATTLPWGIDFGDGVARHPVNLYEILFLCLLAYSLYQLEKRRALVDGARFKLLMAGYLSFRLLIEFWKPVWFFPFGLSSIQLAALGGLFYYRQVFLHPRRMLAATGKA